MDYFLDTKSPLKIYCNKKQGTIGSSYASPNFSYLLKCVSLLLQEKLNSTFLTEENDKAKLTPDEELLLISCESLQKLISDNYQYIAAKLVKQICPNNLYASERVAFVILKGISKSSYETIQPYLQVLHQFVTIEDQHQEKRMKWVLGKQTLAVSTYAKKIIAINSYTLDQRIYNFDSSLYTETGASLLDYLFVYYRKMENFSMLCLKQILKLCEQSSTIRKYIYSLDSPTLSMSKYCQFFKQFINRVCGYYGYYSAAFNKQELGKQLKVLHQKVLKLVSQDNSDPQKSSQQKQQTQEISEVINKITINKTAIDDDIPQSAPSQQKNSEKYQDYNVEQYEEHIIKDTDSQNQDKDNENDKKSENNHKQDDDKLDNDFQKDGNNEEQSIHNLIQCQPVQITEIEMKNIEPKKSKESNQESNNQASEEVYSFKGNEEEEESNNSWEDLPKFQNAQSRESEPEVVHNTQDNYDVKNNAGSNRQKRRGRKNQYQINVVYAEKQNSHAIYDQITSMQFSSEQDEPLMRSKEPYKNHEEQTTKKGTSQNHKDYNQTFHPIIFEYVPVREVLPTQQKEQGQTPKDLKIFYHQSLVTFALTKPTGSSNRSVQMGMNGQKVVDRFFPEVMEKTKTQICSGYFIRNDGRDFIRVETEDGCSYVKGLESIWVWAQQIKRAWVSQRCIDLPKWSLFEELRKEKAQKK